MICTLYVLQLQGKASLFKLLQYKAIEFNPFNMALTSFSPNRDKGLPFDHQDCSGYPKYSEIAFGSLSDIRCSGRD